jgi:uncharacterized protein (TIGR02270 family)
MPVLPSVLEQHVDEAPFLWSLRARLVQAQTTRLHDLLRLDRRIQHHLDGLRLAQDAGREACMDALDAGEAGEFFVAAVLALESGDQQGFNEVMEMAGGDPALACGIASALGWLPFEKVEDVLRKLWLSENGLVARIALAGFALHRKDPGHPLLTLLASHHPGLLARALKAAGELGRMDCLGAARGNAYSEDDKCRFYAAWSATLLGDRSALPTLKALAVESGSYAQRACDLVVRKSTPADAMQWLEQLARQPALLRTAVWGYGVMGDPAAVPRLLEMMQLPEMARPAGGAFSMITGVNLDNGDLKSEQPEGFQAGPTEDPEDENVDLDPDEDLPWPDPELIEKWWADNEKKYQKGRRYLCGQPLSQVHGKQILANGCQSQRVSAALELALMKPGEPLFEIRAPGFVQQRLLADSGV